MSLFFIIVCMLGLWTYNNSKWIYMKHETIFNNLWYPIKVFCIEKCTVQQHPTTIFSKIKKIIKACYGYWNIYHLIGGNNKKSKAANHELSSTFSHKLSNIFCTVSQLKFVLCFSFFGCCCSLKLRYWEDNSCLFHLFCWYGQNVNKLFKKRFSPNYLAIWEMWLFYGFMSSCFSISIRPDTKCCTHESRVY